MNTLFGDDLVDRDIPELPDGAYLVRGWLGLEQQRWIVARFHEWTQGPVPIRAAKVRGHEMSVRTVCLGWHWRPYEYTREAVDVNGNRVLDFPDWMVRLGRKALVAVTGDARAGDSYTPDTALVNYYDDTARMGMHQDKDERSMAPVVSLSIGDALPFPVREHREPEKALPRPRLGLRRLVRLRWPFQTGVPRRPEGVRRDCARGMRVGEGPYQHHHASHRSRWLNCEEPPRQAARQRRPCAGSETATSSSSTVRLHHGWCFATNGEHEREVLVLGDNDRSVGQGVLPEAPIRSIAWTDLGHVFGNVVVVA